MRLRKAGRSTPDSCVIADLAIPVQQTAVQQNTELCGNPPGIDRFVG